MIWFSGFALFFQYNFWIGFENFKSFYLEKTQSNGKRPTAMITICKYYIEPW